MGLPDPRVIAYKPADLSQVEGVERRLPFAHRLFGQI